jgi:hypothetical protein
MSAGSTQAHHGDDQENMPKTRPSPAEIARAFGVVLGPTPLLEAQQALTGTRLAGAKPFHDAQLVPLSALDNEAFRLNVLQRAPQQVIATELDRQRFQQPLDSTSQPG